MNYYNLMLSVTRVCYLRGKDLSDYLGIIAAVVVPIVIAVVILLICRELVCWYLKINQMSSQLSEINANLREIARNTRGPVTPAPTSSSRTTTSNSNSSSSNSSVFKNISN